MTTKRRTTFVLGQITLADALNDSDPLSFDAPQRPPLTARITCRVCEKPAEIPILSSGLLCNLCRQNLDATEAHIRSTLAAAELRFQNALDTWNATYAQAEPRDQERYHAVEEARGAGGVGFRERYQRAVAKGDGLSALLKAKEQCDDVTKEVQGRLAAWAERALLEIESARAEQRES